MDFSVPSPSSSSSDSSSYLTDEISKDTLSGNISVDIDLDLLQHNSQKNGDSSMDDSSSGDAPSDWPQLTSLWPVEGMKYPDLGLEFNLELPLDTDYNPSMTVEPSALHFDQNGFPQSIFSHPSFYSTNTPSDLLSASFPFTFGSEDSSSSSDGGKPRRFSITSSSSSSGAASSPVITPSTAVGLSAPPSYDDSVDELGQRVRQSSGVMLAVPMGLHCQPAPHQAKPPIPRQPRPKITAKAKRNSQKSATSSTSSTPPPDSALGSPVTNPFTDPTVPGVVGRPKTSHTTIERRYRTNLNARIQSLRQAVPALRVLEEKTKGKKDIEGKEKPIVDIVDERGFVDGVKVARKCSKANVLGKAVEYIRVLKKREGRLTHEQNGLRSLICGLVGGPALLKEWEQEWRRKFGGAEKDEVEGEEMEPLSDDDEGDDEEGEGDEDDGRAKKKAKIVRAPAKTKKPAPATIQAALTMAGAETVVPEKRKRGRPRKVLSSKPEEVSPAVEFTTASDQSQPKTQTASVSPLPHGQAPQYLLATFALFSFFNSPLTSSNTHPHTHSGSVLGHTPSLHPSASAVPVAVTAGFGWREVIQAFHLFVSALVFLSIVVPWLPASFRRLSPVSYVLWPFSWLFSDQKGDKSSPNPPPSQPAKAMRQTVSFDRAALIDVLSSSSRGSTDEAEQLRSALGVSTGLLGLVQSVFGKKANGVAFEQKGLEQRAWIRLGELAVLDRTTSFLSRLQAYWCGRSYISVFTASTSDLTTLALVVRPLSNSEAFKLWSRAKKTRVVRPYEKLVLENLGVDEAADRLATRPACEWKHNPMAILASTLVQERLKRHTTILFVRTVLPACGWVEDAEKEEKVTIDAARSLGGRTGELAEMLERVWKTEVSTLDDILGESNDESEAERDIRSLLSALILYRRIFPSAILSSSGTNSHVSILLSPPPSPSRKNAPLYLALRKVLGSSVFDFHGDFGQEKEEEQCLGAVLEEARDGVVDMLVDFDRKSRGGKGEPVF